MILDMLFRHMLTLFLILLFSFMLLNKKTFRNTETKYFWLVVICCFLLVVQDALETMSALDPSMRFFRILLSVIGYTLRSVVPLGLLLVILPSRKRNLLLWIPSLLTFLTSCTAFFTDIAFGFDNTYAFYRGPLGYIAFIVPVFYLAFILIIAFKRFSQKKGLEKYIPTICAILCMASTVDGVLHGGVRLNEALMISSIFFYIILYSHDSRCDTLTGLLNRQAFYDDCSVFNKDIRAAASLDMNGLKVINDTYGHLAGDVALKKIGEFINEVADYSTYTYRVGGDEFIILFFHDDIKLISKLIDKIKKNVTSAGYSISVGYAVRNVTDDLHEVIKKSDHEMYRDKEDYYRTNGIDRTVNHEAKMINKKSWSKNFNFFILIYNVMAIRAEPTSGSYNLGPYFMFGSFLDRLSNK